jgi:putative ABC transport system permease protein
VLKKMKEIAVRKVVGARPVQIVSLVNRGYVLIFGIAAVVGCFAGRALTKLLMDSIFKVNAGVSADVIGISVVVLFVTAAATSWLKVRQAIRANPAEVLKAE